MPDESPPGHAIRDGPHQEFRVETGNAGSGFVSPWGVTRQSELCATYVGASAQPVQSNAQSGLRGTGRCGAGGTKTNGHHAHGTCPIARRGWLLSISQPARESCKHHLAFHRGLRYAARFSKPVRYPSADESSHSGSSAAETRWSCRGCPRSTIVRISMSLITTLPLRLSKMINNEVPYK